MDTNSHGNGWRVIFAENGVAQVRCQHWLGFVHFVDRYLIQIKDNVFRGQALSDWDLVPTLDRVASGLDVRKLTGVNGFMAEAVLRNRHLESFKYAARGRRGRAPVELSDDDWWALGQHYGLATPLLDWSESPYVAAYFAFCEDSFERKGTASVFCLSLPLINNRISDLKSELGDGFDAGDVVRFISPLADDNARLVHQRGLFTICQSHLCLKEWVRTYFSGSRETPLVELQIPRSERAVAMRHLNRMNVSHLTLFPDLSGATGYCNQKLTDHLY